MDNKSAKKGKAPLLILLILIAAAAAAGAWLLFKDTQPPALSLTPVGGWVGADTEFTAGAHDPGSGLASFSVTLIQGGKEKEVVSKTFDTKVGGFSETFTIGTGTLADGNFTVRVAANDRSLTNLGSGISDEITREYGLDSTPPRIALLSSVHNINRGGTGATVFTVSEDVDEVGVKVAGELYPAYLQENGEYVALFPFPFNMTEEEYKPMVSAMDKAGNENTRYFNYNARAKRFRSDRLNIPDSFLARKAPEFQPLFPEETTDLGVYLRANRDLRRQNAAVLYEIGRESGPTPQWEGAFVRMMGAPRARFGDQRDYYYKGEKIDHQVHLGVDIAKLKHTPVPAANNGEVVFAGDLGIYGNTVIIDHGLGLQTLYAHLSRMDVTVGQEIKKGEIVGLTGVSGLAGGDHLHFGVLVSGMPVNPIEWWDAHWIRDNISSKLQ